MWKCSEKTDKMNQENEYKGGSYMIDKRLTVGIRELEDLIRSIKDNSHLGVWEVDLRTGEVTFSDETFKIISLNSSDFDGTVDFIANEIVHKDYQEIAQFSINKALKNISIESMEYPINAEGQIQRWVRINGIFISDEEGAPLKITGVVQDITAMKFYENELETDSEFLETIVDIIHNPIFYKDAKGIYQFCNTAFCEFVGRPKSEIIGSSVFDIAPKNLADTYHKRDEALFNSKGHQAYESQVMHSDGELRDVIFLKSIYTDVAEQASGLIGIILDITPEPRLRAYKDYIAFLNETIMDLDRNMNDYTHVTCMLEELTSRLIKHIQAAEKGCIFEFDSETGKLENISSLQGSGEKSSPIDHGECPKKLTLNHEALSGYVKKKPRYSLPFDLKNYEKDTSPVGNLIDLHHNDHSKLLLPLVYNGKLAHVIVLEAGENTAFTDMDGILADYVTQKIPLLYQIYTLTRKIKAFKNS